MFSIAIDGPAGAGKSTVAKRLAADCQMIYVDTGAMYRTIGYYILQQGLNPKNPEDVIPQLPNIHIGISYSQEGGQRISLNGKDVSQEIRLPEMSMASSNVSAIPQVRSFLLDLQRNMAKEYDVIMDGRDIGTVVLPNADLKIFLTASPEERSRRRFLEYQAKGLPTSYEDTLADVQKRDYQDSHREVAPLKQAQDAVLLDTTGLNFEQTVEQIKLIIKERFCHVL